MANELSREQIVIEAEGVEEAIRKAEELTRAFERTAQAAGQAGSYGALPAEGMRPGYLPMPPIRSSRVTSAQRTDYGSAALVQAAREAQRIARELDRAGGTWMSRMNAQIRSAVAEAKQLNMGGLRGGLGAVPGVAVAASGGALWARGFAGTLESNRLNRELDLLGREVAGAFKPVTDEFTRSIRDLREWLQRMSPRGQDHLLAAATVAAGIGGVQMATGRGAKARDLAKSGKEVLLALGVADRIDLGVKTLRSRFESGEADGKGTWLGRRLGYTGTMSTNDLQDTGYGRIARIKDPTQRQAAVDAELAKIREMKSQLDRDFYRNPIGYFSTSVTEVLGYNLFDDEATRSYRKNLEYTRSLSQREKVLSNIGAGQAGIGPDNSRRRVTPDDIQYGEVGSAYDDAQLGLLKVATVGEKQLAKLDEIEKHLAKIAGEAPMTTADYSRTTR